MCVYVELDYEDVGKQVAEYFGVNGEAPTVSIRLQPFIFVVNFNRGFCNNENVEY